MSQIFFNELEIPEPDYNLGIGSEFEVRREGSNWQIGEMLKKLDVIFKYEKPDLVAVFGDTNSTLAGALTASKLSIPVVHIEAGLRSYDHNMPEEINRVLTDHLSDYLFCPSRNSELNLTREGIVSGTYITGDVMFDVLLEYINNIDEEEVFDQFSISNCLEKDRYILLTIHRAGNTDDIKRLYRIMETMNEISNTTLPIIFPVHPRTQKALSDCWHFSENFILCDPVGYKEMLILEKNSKFVITDSGGVQKESYFFKKPSLILRDRTEWIEIVSSNWSYLVDDNKELTLNKANELCNNEYDLQWFPFYGEGDATDKIVNIIKDL